MKIVYVVNAELWWHAVATQPVCVYEKEEDANKHVAILKEKGWHAFVMEIQLNPDPVEFTSHCIPRKEFVEKQNEIAKEIRQKNEKLNERLSDGRGNL